MKAIHNVSILMFIPWFL